MKVRKMRSRQTPIQEYLDTPEFGPEDDEFDDTSSAAESFAAMERMAENYRKGAELYGSVDVADLKDFDDEGRLDFAVDSPERQWYVLKQTAKRAEAESRITAAEYKVRMENSSTGFDQVRPVEVVYGRPPTFVQIGEEAADDQEQEEP